MDKEKYKQSNAWGLSAAIDLKQCNHNLVRDAEAIRRFVYELCELIEVERYGECQIVHFGEREEIAGFSMTQLIETSLISGHFVNATNDIYLDVFSCQYYDPDVVAEKAKTYFQAKELKMQILLRN